MPFSESRFPYIYNSFKFYLTAIFRRIVLPISDMHQTQTGCFMEVVGLGLDHIVKAMLRRQPLCVLQHSDSVTSDS